MGRTEEDRTFHACREWNTGGRSYYPPRFDPRCQADRTGCSRRIRLAGPEAVLTKLHEEVAELRAEMPEAIPARLADEMGDVLFVLANLARKLDLDPETCLRQANLKFYDRFNKVEQLAELEGRILSEMSLEEMEEQWMKIKQIERLGR